MLTDAPLLIGWKSQTHGDIISHSRVICVKAGATTGSLVVRLEDDNFVTIMPDEAESFTESYMTYLHAAQALELQVINEDDTLPSNSSLKRRSN